MFKGKYYLKKKFFLHCWKNLYKGDLETTSYVLNVKWKVGSHYNR